MPGQRQINQRLVWLEMPQKNLVLFYNWTYPALDIFRPLVLEHAKSDQVSYKGEDGPIERIRKSVLSIDNTT